MDEGMPDGEFHAMTNFEFDRCRSRYSRVPIMIDVAPNGKLLRLG
jgi:hypothetical protein